MWALVQVRPEAQVLAISASRAELERELAEINETWNHWELRGERQRYAIQPAPVLFPAPPEPGAPAPCWPGADGGLRRRGVPASSIPSLQKAHRIDVDIHPHAAAFGRGGREGRTQEALHVGAAGAANE